MQPHEVLRLASGGLAVILMVAASSGRARSSRHPVRAVLSAGQIALATLLVIWAGLLLRNVIQIRSLDLRANGGGAKIAILALRSDKYGAPDQRQAFFGAVMARLSHVAGIRVHDPGSALPLAGGAYFAVFFAIGEASPSIRLPDGQQFVTWQADIGSDLLAQEVNQAVKTFDRGIHYWHVGTDAPRATYIVYSAYAIAALLLIRLGSHGKRFRYGSAATAAGILIGLGLARATTWLLTGSLWGVSVTDFTTFAAGAGIVAGTALLASFQRTRESVTDYEGATDS